MDEIDDAITVNLSIKPSELWPARALESARAVGGPLDLDHRPRTTSCGLGLSHPDGIWPDSQKWIAADLAGVSPAVQRKIVCENAGKLYGFM